jgi:hypothetical protein
MKHDPRRQQPVSRVEQHHAEPLDRARAIERQQVARRVVD